ncbi:MAG: agmatinase [Dehalococcoidia bacterium]|nr:agmatinase [Dehalococcoidia bacterium]
MQGAFTIELYMSSQQALYSHPRNFAGIPEPFSTFKSARVAILPVPYDSTTEWHSGSRNGPRSIIEASYYLEWYDIELKKEPYRIGIHTMPELEPAYSSPEINIDRVYRASAALLRDSKFVITLGGEHSISLGSIRAHVEKYSNCSVLQMDAHTDLRDEYLGTKYGHACVMRRVEELCPITQVGIRAISLEEIEHLSSSRLKPFFFEQDNTSLPINDIVSTVSENVYVSIDLDVFDPSIMSSVGTPEPGGILWYQALHLLNYLSKQRNIIGFDIVELCPDQGPASCSFLAAKLAYKLIGYIFDEQLSA